VKKFISLVMIGVIVLAMTACGDSASSEGGNSSDGDKVVLKLGNISPEDHAWNKGARKFAELVSEKTDGSVEVEIYPNSTLGNDRDLIEGMQMGSVDMAIAAGVISNFAPKYSLLELPYLFRDYDHLEKVLYGPVGDDLKSYLLEETGIRALDFWTRTSRQLTSNKKVESVEDLEGLKIRVPEIPAMVDSWEALGANPTPMAFGDVYTALETGVIDAQENPFALIESSKFYEVQDQLTLTNHLYGYVALMISDKTFEKLSEEQQKAINEAAKEATEYENNLVLEQKEKLFNKLKEKMNVTEIEDLTPFKEKVKEVQEKYAEKYDEELYERIINTK